MAKMIQIDADDIGELSAALASALMRKGVVFNLNNPIREYDYPEDDELDFDPYLGIQHSDIWHKDKPHRVHCSRKNIPDVEYDSDSGRLMSTHPDYDVEYVKLGRDRVEPLLVRRIPIGCGGSSNYSGHCGGGGRCGGGGC